METSTTSSAIADVVRDRAHHAFGLVGNANSHVVSDLTSQGFPYTAVRHEAATVTAADAFYRASSRSERIAVATTTCGAGFTNTITALAEAKYARIPLVFIAGTAPAAAPRHFDVDQAALLDAMGIIYLTVSPSSARIETSIAFDLAESLREPVVILLPHDLQESQLEHDGAIARNAHHDPYCVSSAAAPHAADASMPASDTHAGDSLADIAELLSTAHRPVIVSGRGVVLSHTEEMVAKLGDEIGAIHLTSAMANNVFDAAPEADSELFADVVSLGISGGFAHAEVVDVMRSADAILVLGASFNPFQARGGKMFPAHATVAHIIDEPHPAAMPVDKRVYADLRDALPQLLRLITKNEYADGWDLAELRLQLQRGDFTPAPAHTVGEDGRLDPRAALHALNLLLPQQRCVCTDGGHFLGWVPKYLDTPDPDALALVGSAIQSIGLGCGSAVGIAAARPSDYTVLVTGDGGGLMALSDLESAIRAMRGRNGTPGGAIVVMNDAAYGAELHQYAAAGLDTESMVIDDIDFAALGSSLGARGITIRTMADFDLVATALHDNPADVLVLDVKISQCVVADFIKEVLQKR
ncbi:thiamine pyrophosphate-binding protein [Corynebacterium sp. H78]|uniref:thiamine pyrophosphate-binding protein n=1 Tax=Corynebacterium sp. H78 TaxID=3133417 RepID=UPI00309B07FF